MDVATACRDCGRAALPDARWCPDCGQSLAEPTAEQPGADHPAKERRDWRRLARRAATGVVLGALIAGAVWVVRPRPPLLHEANAGTNATAAGRDAARTGIVAELSVGQELVEVARTVLPGDGKQDVTLSLVGNLVLLVDHQAGGTTAFDRATGAQRWTQPGVTAAPYFDQLVVDGSARGPVVLDPGTGEPAWTVEDDSGWPFFVVDDVVLFQDVDGTTIHGRAAGDGALLWSTALAFSGFFAEFGYDGWVVLSVHGGDHFGGQGVPDPGALAVNVADGAATRLPLRPGERAVVIGGGRAVVFDQNEPGWARVIDLGSGESVDGPGADLLGHARWVDAGGDLVVVNVGDGFSVLGRDDLSLRFERASNGADVMVHGMGLQSRRWMPDGAEVDALDPSTGEVIGSWFEGRDEPLLPIADGQGIVRARGPVIWHESFVEAGSAWLTLAGEVEPASLLAGGDEVVVLRGESFLRVLPGLALGPEHRRAAPFNGQGAPAEVVATVGSRTIRTVGRNLNGLIGLEPRWTAGRDAAPVGVVASGNDAWVATSQEIARLSVVDGKDQVVLATGGGGRLSLAGEELLVSVAERRVTALDPTTLRELWSTAVADDLCAGATLAERRVTVATADGWIALDASTGAVLERGDLPGAEACRGLTWWSGRLVVVAGDELLLVQNGLLRRVSVGAEIVGLPLVARDGLLVATQRGLLAIGEGEAVTWSIDWPVPPISGPVPHDRGVAILLADDSLVHLR